MRHTTTPPAPPSLPLGCISISLWEVGGVDFVQLETSGTDTEDTKAQLASVTAAQFWIKLMHKNDYGYPRVVAERVGDGAASEWMHLNVSVKLVWVVPALRCIFFFLFFFFLFVFVLVKN